MGNKATRPETVLASSAVAPIKHVQFSPDLDQILATQSVTFRSRSLSATISRPWSRHSRRRWKESTLTLPFECSKTAWPVSRSESYFLPEFPINTNLLESSYQILSLITKGAFGKVYKVTDLESNQIFALKVLSKSKIIKENCLKQVKEEVQIQRACGHHPFIVNCPSNWQNKNRLYIVTSFVEGGELFELLKKYIILPLELVQLYVAQIALAIDFLHNAGVIYRDLKPENILLDEQGNIQLIDFGLAKWLKYSQRTSTICGTLHYMAPEVLTQSYGHAADWWSLGVIACVMLTNKFPSPVMRKTDNSELESKPGSLPTNIDLDHGPKDLLMRLLEVDPSKRLRSYRELGTIAFYKGYKLDKIKEKQIRPNDLLKKHFPQGPPVQLESPENSECPDQNLLLKFDESLGEGILV